MRNPGLDLAGRIGLEPISFRLTGDCSTIELTSPMPPGPATWRINPAPHIPVLSGCEVRQPLTHTTIWCETQKAEGWCSLCPVFHDTILSRFDCPRSILLQFLCDSPEHVHRAGERDSQTAEHHSYSSLRLCKILSLLSRKKNSRLAWKNALRLLVGKIAGSMYSYPLP